MNGHKNSNDIPSYHDENDDEIGLDQGFSNRST